MEKTGFADIGGRGPTISLLAIGSPFTATTKSLGMEKRKIK